MFSTLPPYTHPHAFPFNTDYMSLYTPHVPSPLSSSPLRRSPSSSPPKECASSPLNPRSTFAFGMDETEDQEMEMSSPTKPKQNIFSNLFSTTNSRPRDTAFSKRPTKPNPLMSKGNAVETRETRRKLFLKRVREGSEDRKWKNRGLLSTGEDEEEILRVLWLREERAREERRRREVSGLQLEQVDVTEDEEAMDTGEELDGYLNMEARELDALVLSQQEALESNFNTEMRKRDMDAETLYGSDEDEYDELFMDFAEEEEKMVSQSTEGPGHAHQPAHNDGDVEMDMS